MAATEAAYEAVCRDLTATTSVLKQLSSAPTASDAMLIEQGAVTRDILA